MKITIGFLTVLALASSAPAASKKKQADPAPQVISIPKDATQNPDGTYSWTDKDGKKWLYAKTPFGVMRSAATPAPPPNPSSSPATTATLQYVKATDKGDTVKFERTTPFGPVVWEKKKAELTVEEKSILDNQTAKPAGGDAR